MRPSWEDYCRQRGDHCKYYDYYPPSMLASEQANVGHDPSSFTPLTLACSSLATRVLHLLDPMSSRASVAPNDIRNCDLKTSHSMSPHDPTSAGGGPSPSLALDPSSTATGWSDQHNFLAFVQHLHKSGYIDGGDVPGMTVR